VNGPEEIGFQRLGPVFEPITSYGRRGVIDQNVKTTEGCFRERHEGPGVWLAFHVRAAERGTTSGALDQTHRFVAASLVDVRDDYGGACHGKTSRYGATASGTTRSRDDYDTWIVQLSRHAAEIPVN
jgi:hypothetical protein